jgi:Fur family peroxide stress response transcriptional regulator
MAIAHQWLKDKLLTHGVRATYQRVRILEFLIQKGGHPTAEGIYTDLIAEIPTLSKTTVYNTLHTFAEAGLLRIVHIDAGEAHFDATAGSHGHFQCLACGALIDFPLDFDRIPIAELEQFEIREKSVTFRGLCPSCRAGNPTEAAIFQGG